MVVKTFMKAIMLVLLFTAISSAGTKKQNFTKLDAQGNSLPDNAKEWVMVRDNTTQLIWEIKTEDGSIHDKSKTFTYKEAEEKLIAEMNRTKFGGFNDWRMPSNDELYSIRLKGSEPYINGLFFPHTIPSSYHSWRLCGSGEIFNEKVKFGKKRNKGAIRHARAVRGKAADK